MADNVQKTHLALTLNRFAEKKVYELIQLTGKALPCSIVSVSGSIVTVKFELTNIPYTLPNVTVPSGFPEYMRVPLQPGDGGVVFPADAYLGGVSGLGGGVADLSLRANLSCLVFFPIANKNWAASENPNAFVLYGPDGVVIRPKNSKAVVKVDSAGNAVLHGLTSYAWDVNGYGVKITYTGGSGFRQDNYTQGATVTQVNHAWTPPGPI